MNRSKAVCTGAASVIHPFGVASSRRAIGLLFFCSGLLARPAEMSAPAPAPDLAELPLETLMDIEVPTVYGASKLEQKVTAAPSSVTVITAEEIKRYGYRTLADVLQSVPGLQVSYDRNYKFLGFRGVNLGDFNSRILLLVNGHRVNNDLTDGAHIGTAFILDVDLIERVEVIRGPGSVLYGNNAFFGVVNVVTREGKQLNGAEVSGEYGSFDTYKGRFSYGCLTTNGVQMLVSGTLYESAGPEELFYKEFNTPYENHGIAVDKDDDSYRNFFGSLGYRDLVLEGAFLHREKGNPTAQYLTTFNDPRLRTVDERSYAALKYTHSFADIVDVTARAYYDRSDYSIGYPVSLYSGTNLIYSAFFQEKDVGEWWGSELQLNKRLWDVHMLTLGAEYRDDFRQEREFTGQPTVRKDRRSYGIYAQGDFQVLTNLHLNGGVRYDQYGDFDPSWSPRLALIYHPVENSALKAIYGTAFRTPNFLELALSPPGQLQPEDITTYELAYEQVIARHLRSSISGYYNEMRDLIVIQNGSSTNCDANAAGTEVALEGAWTDGLRGRVSYSYQHTENRSFNWDLPDSPHHLVKFNLSVPIVRDKIFASIEAQYTSSRKSLHNTNDASGQPLTLQGEEAAGFGIVNVTLFSQNLIKNLEFSGSVYNLLDRKYSDPATRFHRQDLLAQDGRTFRIKLTYHF